MISSLRTAISFRNRSALLVLAGLVFGLSMDGANARPATYASPQEAVDALVGSIRSGSTRNIVAVLGPEAQRLASSGDSVADEAARARFLAAYDESSEIRQTGDGPYILHLGHNDFPFPIPLVSESGKWRFDTAAGAEEIIDRRIGENELAAVEVMRAYVDAQREYAETDRDGKGVQYARRILSRPGQTDGLYWPTAEGDPESPFGPLIADARAEGYSARRARPTPYHGYVFKVLTAQGKDAPGGARDYIVRGRMIGGFGLVASPADYGGSGVMTFIVSHEGKIFEKDLGEGTARYARRINAFSPDATWKPLDSN